MGVNYKLDDTPNTAIVMYLIFNTSTRRLVEAARYQGNTDPFSKLVETLHTRYNLLCKKLWNIIIFLKLYL